MLPIVTKIIAGKCLYPVGDGRLIASLAEALAREDVLPLATGIAGWHDANALGGEAIVLFRYGAFVDDVAKTNLAETHKQWGLGNMRSL